MSLRKILAAATVAWIFSSSAEAVSLPTLPIVDLGYVRHQATKFNSTRSIYTFSNIRYGQAPIGDLRWTAPLPPKPEPILQHGEKDRICFQSQPEWQPTVLGPWLDAWGSNNTASFYKKYPKPPALPPVPANLSTLFPPLLASETEDCLFLDVYVPKEIFDHREKRKGSAVFLWVHGGGLVLGSKTADSFEGLVARSRDRSQEPVIVVSINYRLGAFGFLGGPTLKANGGVSNAGLLDQRLAFEWVQKYIHNFGGDPQRVTAAGESAGGASIFHHITASGGGGKLPAFQQALIQSGGWNPVTNSNHLEQVYGEFLKALKVSSLLDAKRLSSLDVRNGNFLMAFYLRWGELGFGVEVDGDYVPQSPAKLLLDGKFHRNIRIMIGQNAAEGVIFTSPWIRNEQDTLSFLSDNLPTASNIQKSLVAKALYPPVFDGSTKLPYRSYLDRANLIVSEVGVLCNSDFLARALNGKIFNYLFNVPPALHADDLAYTFYDGEDSTIDGAVASRFQSYILNFVRTGDPNSYDLPKFEEYGKSAWTMDVKKGGFERIVNPGANERCRCFQDGFF